MKRLRRGAWIAHTILGGLGGAVLTLVCLTGSIATIAPDLDRWMGDDRVSAPSGPRPNWDAAVFAAEQRHGAGRVRAAKHHGTRVLTRVETDEGLRLLAHDAGTGRVLSDRPFLNIRWVFRDLHRQLIGGRVGHYVVCVSSLFLLLSFGTGLLFERRPWRRFRRAPTHSQRARAWHVRSALIVLPFGVVFGATGLWYLGERIAEDLGVRVSPAYPDQGQPAASRPPSEFVSLARQHLPDLSVRSIWFGDATLVVEGQTDALFVRDRANAVVLRRHDGDVLQVRHPGGMGALERWSHSADPLHFGTFAGLWSRWLWFLAGILLTLLCGSGSWMQFRRLFRDQPSKSIVRD